MTKLNSPRNQDCCVNGTVTEGSIKINPRAQLEIDYY